MGVCSDDLAIGPDGTLYGVDRGGMGEPPSNAAESPAQLLTYDTNPASATYGASTAVGPLGLAAPAFVRGLTFDATGVLWLVASQPLALEAPTAQADPCIGTCLYRVNPATGAATFVAPVSTAGSSNIFVTSAAGSASGSLYVAFGTITIVVLPSVDESTTTTTSRTDDSGATDEISADDVASDAATDDVGGTAAEDHAGPLVTILRLGILNTTTGQITDVGEISTAASIDFASDQTLWGIDRPFGPASTSTSDAGPSVVFQSTFKINVATGLATAITTIAGSVGTPISSLAIAPVPLIVSVQPRFTG